MQNYTQGSIPRHIIRMAVPIFAGMVFQTLYFLVDLYFVARLGGDAVAGVSAAGNLQFIVLALTQVLSVGTMVLIAHASGRKERDDANLVFHQSLLMAAACMAITLAGGFALAGPYARALGANAATADAAHAYLMSFVPALALQFALVTMGSALRGTGVAMMLVYFLRLATFVAFDRAQLRPHFGTWKRVLRIGLPAGGEFALMFVYLGVIYVIIRDVGAAAQAGFGIGSRVMQSLFIPAMAVAFAAAPSCASSRRMPRWSSWARSFSGSSRGTSPRRA